MKVVNLYIYYIYYFYILSFTDCSTTIASSSNILCRRWQSLEIIRKKSLHHQTENCYFLRFVYIFQCSKYNPAKMPLFLSNDYMKLNNFALGDYQVIKHYLNLQNIKKCLILKVSTFIVTMKSILWCIKGFVLLLKVLFCGIIPYQ